MPASTVRVQSGDTNQEIITTNYVSKLITHGGVVFFKSELVAGYAIYIYLLYL